MNNKSIYNKIPEGYVPVPKSDKSKELQLLRQGSITEITLGDKTFQVHDPVKIEQLIKLVERHEERLHSVSNETAQLKRKIQYMENEIRTLRNSINKLQDQIKNAGFNQF
ncbi:hypothetical protein FOI42_RS02020 [Escherichia coli]|nr:keratin [Escherichia coli]